MPCHLAHKGDTPAISYRLFFTGPKLASDLYKLNTDMPPDAGTMALYGISNRDSMNIKQVPLVLFSKLFRGTVLGLDSLQDRTVSS